MLAPYQVELGAFNSVGNMIGGMGSLLENPISTAANVVMHPIDVAEAAWGGVTGTFSNLFSGNPYQMGQAVGNIAMAVAPFAGEFGDVADAAEAIPRGVTYESTVFRSVSAGSEGSAWEVTARNIAADHRYSAIGRGAIYASTSQSVVAAEMQYYGLALATRSVVSAEVSIGDILDLTNPLVRDQLGITLEQITGNDYTLRASAKTTSCFHGPLAVGVDRGRMM